MAPAGIRPAVDSGVDSIEHGLFLSADDLPVLAARNGAWVPTILGAESIIGFLGAGSTGGKLLAAGIRNVRELLPEAERLGATVLAGTDLAVPHGRVALEAIRLHEFGLSMPAALHAATRAAYDYLGVAREFTPGSIADVVFVRDDPREYLETLLDPAMIIRSGRFITG
jgi:imidazolonepropionase-like amidohydrolase